MGNIIIIIVIIIIIIQSWALEVFMEEDLPKKEDHI